MSKMVNFDSRRDPIRETNRMSKINTTLLSICTAGILWMAKEVNSLDSRVSAVEVLLQEKTGNLSQRVTTLETRQDQEGPKIFEIGARVDVLESHLSKKSQ